MPPTGFFFRQEPYQRGDHAADWLDFGLTRERLGLRIRHSRGGAFLLCGFRGVGKTSLVNRVLDDLSSHPSDRTFLTLRLSLARPVEPIDLLYSISRCLHEELNANGILDRLPKYLSRRLWLGYLRTAASVAVSRSQTQEYTGSVALALPARAKSALTGSSGFRATSTENSSLAYLAYGQADAEYDLISSIQMLSSARISPRSIWRRVLRRTDPPVSIVLVLDELDKLSSTEEGLLSLRRLLVSMKSLLATTGIHIICVAGVELYDEARRDAARGNGIYESLFSWIEYIPCRWFTARSFLEVLGAAAPAEMIAPTLNSALDFTSRGSFRRLSQEVSRLITLNELGEPSMALDATEVERLTFLSEMDAIVMDHTQNLGASQQQTIGADRLRLGSYAACDWVLGTQGAAFSADQLVEGPLALDAQLGVSRERAGRFMRRLADAGVLNIAWESSGNETILVGHTDQEPKYKLSDSTRDRLRMLALADPDSYVPSRPASPADGPALIAGPPSVDVTSVPRIQTPRSDRRLWPKMDLPIELTRLRGIDEIDREDELIGPGLRLGHRWTVGDLVAAGGTASIYNAEDALSSSPMLVKVFDKPASLWAPEEWLETWGAGARLLNLKSPFIARTYAAVSTRAEQLALIIEKVEGVSLRAAMNRGMPMNLPRVFESIVRGMSDAHHAGLCSLDAKPENILVHPNGESATLIDIDLATPIDPLARARSKLRRVGTPVYMAPEILAGDFGTAADIFSFGVIFAEAVGVPVRRAATQAEGVGGWGSIADPVDGPAKLVRSSNLSDRLRSFLFRCVDPDPTLRFANLRNLIDECPWDELESRSAAGASTESPAT